MLPNGNKTSIKRHKVYPSDFRAIKDLITDNPRLPLVAIAERTGYSASTIGEIHKCDDFEAYASLGQPKSPQKTTVVQEIVQTPPETRYYDISVLGDMLATKLDQIIVILSEIVKEWKI